MLPMIQFSLAGSGRILKQRIPPDHCPNHVHKFHWISIQIHLYVVVIYLHVNYLDTVMCGTVCFCSTCACITRIHDHTSVKTATDHLLSPPHWPTIWHPGAVGKTRKENYFHAVSVTVYSSARPPCANTSVTPTQMDRSHIVVRIAQNRSSSSVH